MSTGYRQKNRYEVSRATILSSPDIPARYFLTMHRSTLSLVDMKTIIAQIAKSSDENNPDYCLSTNSSGAIIPTNEGRVQLKPLTMKELRSLDDAVQAELRRLRME
jgi:hypothetical protein